MRATTRRWPSRRRARPPTAPRCASGCARRGSRTASMTNWRASPRALAASMPRRCSSARSRSTARATTTSSSSTSHWSDDLREAEVPDGASPVKSAAEVFRIFRDSMRSVVELGGLSLDSYLDFNADICSRIHRLVAGPARAALPADTGADGRRSGPRAIWSRAGSGALRRGGEACHGSDAHLLHGV